jgi:thiosulfate/3-mercaptopyruvate sulfurtransferase
VIEAAWGAPKFYLLSHIPGAGYIDTNEVESEPLWNKVSDAQLKAMLAKHGIRHDTTVILYGRDVYAAARVAQIHAVRRGERRASARRRLENLVRCRSAGRTRHAAGTKPAPDFGAPIPASRS